MTDKFLAELYSLTIFRNILSDSVVSAFMEVLSHKADCEEVRVNAYCEFVGCFYQTGAAAWSDYVSRLVNDDENVYIRMVCGGKAPSNQVINAVYADLRVLSALGSVTAEELKKVVDTTVALPSFDTGITDISDAYDVRMSNIGRHGYGIYARYSAFFIDDEGAIVPVKKPDSITLSELIDYEREKQVIIDNTLALIGGRPAANMLLTGDAGTGKSSTIKAVANRFREEGVRIIEVRKEQLFRLPHLLSELNENPLKFIIFVDDLSFAKDDDNFGALKAILEGSVSAKCRNIVIYATSNRRHLVRESFSDRDGDDIHRNDTMQEIISLSDRFGIQLSFYRPDKNTFLHIVKSLALANGIDMTEEELFAEAERFVLGRGNRSARAAKQFVDQLLAGN